MDTEVTKDYWRRQLFRDIAHFVHEPSTANRAKLILLMDTYRYFNGDAAPQERRSDHPLGSY